MNYFKKKRKLKDFLISILLILVMTILVFDFISVSEGSTNNETININSTSKNINESIENISNVDNKSVIYNNSNKRILSAYGGIKGYNESSNVILEFNVTSIYLIVMCGGSQSYLYLDAALRYKEDNSPLSNQIVYWLLGMKQLLLLQMKMVLSIIYILLIFVVL